MNIRSDFQDVSGTIEKLHNIGEEFFEFEKHWSHLKNKEDYSKIFSAPAPDSNKMEKVYTLGKSIAGSMSSELRSINTNYSEYPTLTDVIDKLEESIEFTKENNWVIDDAKPLLPHYREIFAFGAMYNLYERQSKLVKGITIAVNVLKSSNLFKIENGIETMAEAKNITVTGNSGAVNIHSSGATATVSNTTDYIQPPVFKEMLSTVRSSDVEPEIEEMLVSEITTLADTHKQGSFVNGYADFIAKVSDHVTVLTPFMAPLAALLAG